VNFFESLIDGMDTPKGLIAGAASVLCIAGPFFPMFPNLRSIFPPPAGWAFAESAAIATFCCVAIKSFVHTFGRDMEISAEKIKACGIFWVGAFLFHYVNRPTAQTEDHDPINMVVYGALFGIPTFAFSAMQIHAARRRR